MMDFLGVEDVLSLHADQVALYGGVNPRFDVAWTPDANQPEAFPLISR